MVLVLAMWCGAATDAAVINADRVRNVVAGRFGQKGTRRVQDWLHLMQDEAARPEMEKLTDVNAFWDRQLLQAEDITVWGKEDYWATPQEALGVGAGDCEDFVIGKYFSLLAMGVPGNKMRLVYVRARIGGPGSTEQIAHMVLAYYPTPAADPLVLDSLITTILPASQRRDLTPVFSFNADGIYVNGKQAAPVDRIGHWRDLIHRLVAEGYQP